MLIALVDVRVCVCVCSLKTLQDSYDSLAYFQHTNRGRLGGGATLGQSDDCSTLIGQSAVLWDQQQTMVASSSDVQQGGACRQPVGGAAAQAALACMGLTAASAGKRPVPIKPAVAAAAAAAAAATASVSCSGSDRVGLHEPKRERMRARSVRTFGSLVSCASATPTLALNLILRRCVHRSYRLRTRMCTRRRQSPRQQQREW